MTPHCFRFAGLLVFVAAGCAGTVTSPNRTHADQDAGAGSGGAPGAGGWPLPAGAPNVDTGSGGTPQWIPCAPGTSNDGIGITPWCKPGNDSQTTVPVCGCDGKIYGSECEALAVPVGLAMDLCVTPPGTFRCGPRYCKSGVEYCNLPVLYSPTSDCVPFPAVCLSTRTCDCVKGEICGADCAANPDGDLTLQCHHG